MPLPGLRTEVELSPKWQWLIVLRKKKNVKVVLSVSEIFHLAVLVLLTLSAFFAVWFRDLLSSVISLGVFSLVMAVEFYLLHAPDVAIAEAAIGAGLNTAIYIIALRGCGKARSETGGDIR
jgi:uncharacterized MnhB-related membrane protein